MTAWCSASGVGSSVSSGDFNETVCGPSDRLVGNSGTRCGNQRFGVVHHMLLSDGFSDLYRDLHPAGDLIDDGPDGHDGHGLGHTMYLNRTTGSSRITIALIRPPPSAEALAAARCHVDNGADSPESGSVFLGGAFGHSPLLFSVPCAAVLASAAPASDSWTGPSIRTAGLTEQQRSDLCSATNSTLSPEGPSMCAELDGLVSDCPTLEHDFAHASSRFVELLYKGAATVTGVRRAGQSKPYRPPPALTRALRARRLAVRLGVALRQTFDSPGGPVFPSTAYSTAAARARADLIHLGFGHLLGDCEGAHWRRTDLWSDLFLRMPTVMASVRSTISRVKLESPAHPSNLKSTLFRTSRDRDKIYRNWCGSAGSTGAIKSALDALGEIQTRPGVYAPIIRDAVATPFSDPHPGPAVPTWRSLSDDEQITGVPFWWEKMYSRSAKGTTGLCGTSL